MKKKIIVEYSSNNSGGGWWLTDKDWKALEKAGWKVKWGDRGFVYNKSGNYTYDDEGYPIFKVNDSRWLGTIAKYAFYKCDTPKEALESFEKATRKSVTDEGCNCCGAPHSFSWEGGYCSGEDCSEYLFGEDISNLSKRELYLKSKK